MKTLRKEGRNGHGKVHAIPVTGNTDIVTELESRHPLDPIIDSLPVTSFSVRLEHKYEKEEWAKFNILVEVCTGECGNFISEDERVQRK